MVGSGTGYAAGKLEILRPYAGLAKRVGAICAVALVVYSGLLWNDTYALEAYGVEALVSAECKEPTVSQRQLHCQEDRYALNAFSRLDPGVQSATVWYLPNTRLVVALIP